MDSAVATIVDAVSGGYSVKMTCSYFLDEMGGWDTDDDEYASVKFLRKNLVMQGPSMTGGMRTWLDEEMWSEVLEDPKNWPEFEEMLRALENYDIGLSEAIVESELDEDDLATEEARLLLREFLDSSKEHNGIDGLIQASREIASATAHRKRPRLEDAEDSAQAPAAVRAL